MDISDLLSGVAIIVSIVAIIASYRSSKLLNSLSVAKLKKEINRLESADIRIVLDTKETHYLSKDKRIHEPTKFKIINKGNSPARNIYIEDTLIANDIEYTWNRYKKWTTPIPKFPIPELKDGSTYQFPLIINDWSGYKNRYVVVTWTDLNGEKKTDHILLEDVYKKIYIN